MKNNNNNKMKSKKTSRSTKSQQKCRCCINPSSSFMEMESAIKDDDGLEKTYKDLLYALTNPNVKYLIYLPNILSNYYHS